MDTILPGELLEYIFLFASASPTDVSRLEGVSKLFRAACRSAWQSIARQRYRNGIYEHTAYLYQNSPKRLLQDDNRLGASLRLELNKACFYRFNRPGYFFCCLVHSIQWDRVGRRVLLHLDVRGEDDLRSPLGSTLHAPSKVPFGHSQTFGGPLGWRLRRNRDRSFDAEWRPLSDNLPPGNFKGYLEFDECCFCRQQGYDFCYSNQGYGFPDYEIIPLLPRFSSLEELFSSGVYVLQGSSPFDADNRSIDRARWKPLIPAEVWSRGASGNSTSWWAEDKM